MKKAPRPLLILGLLLAIHTPAQAKSIFNFFITDSSEPRHCRYEPQYPRHNTEVIVIDSDNDYPRYKEARIIGSDYITPPYPYYINEINLYEVEIIYFTNHQRNHVIFPRYLWQTYGWGAWEHGHRY